MDLSRLFLRVALFGTLVSPRACKSGDDALAGVPEDQVPLTRVHRVHRVLTLFLFVLVGCEASEQPIMKGENLVLPPPPPPMESALELEGVEKSFARGLDVNFSTLTVCLDGTAKPGGSFRVLNTSSFGYALDFKSDGLLTHPSTDRIGPGATATVRLELLALDAVATTTLFDEDRNPVFTIGTTQVVDVRVLDVGRLTSKDNVLSFKIKNPVSLPVEVKFRAKGKFTVASIKTPFIPPRGEIDVPLVAKATMNEPVEVRPGVAAEISVYGTRCSKEAIRDLPVVEVPQVPQAPATP